MLDIIKQQGIVKMESWYFTPKVGIRSSVGEIKFGDSPEDVENIIGSPGFEMVIDVGGTGCWLTLEYSQQDQLVSIFFCMGSLIFEEMEMIKDTTKPQLARYLRKKKFTIKKFGLFYAGLGHYCPEICIEFSSSKDNGGETNIMRNIVMFCSDEYWHLEMESCRLLTYKRMIALESGVKTF
jgi:hypothetical protein